MLLLLFTAAIQVIQGTVFKVEMMLGSDV